MNQEEQRTFDEALDPHLEQPCDILRRPIQRKKTGFGLVRSRSYEHEKSSPCEQIHVSEEACEAVSEVSSLIAQT